MSIQSYVHQTVHKIELDDVFAFEAQPLEDTVEAMSTRGRKGDNRMSSPRVVEAYCSKNEANRPSLAQELVKKALCTPKCTYDVVGIYINKGICCSNGRSLSFLCMFTYHLHAYAGCSVRHRQFLVQEFSCGRVLFWRRSVAAASIAWNPKVTLSIVHPVAMFLEKDAKFRMMYGFDGVSTW